MLDRASLEVGRDIGSTGDEEIARRLSACIEDFIRQKAQEVLLKSQAEYDQFMKSTDAETTLYNEELANDYPDEIAGNPEKFSTYVKQRDHIYNGPLYLNDNQTWAKLVNSATDAINLSSLTKSQDGQAILLKRIFPGPEYTLAHLKRDLRILQLSPPQPVKEVEGISEKLANFVSQANSYAEKSKKSTEEARAKTIEIMQKKFDEFRGRVQSVLNSTLATRQRLRLKLSTNLSRCVIDYESLGTFCKEFQDFLTTDGRIYMLDVANYISMEADPTRMDVATPFEFEMAEIYSKLLNQDNVFLPTEFKGQALKALNSPFANVDFQRFNSDRMAQASAYQGAYSNERATIRNRHNSGDVNLTLDQFRAERNDVQAHPAELKDGSSSRGGDRTYWSYDPKYLSRLIGVISGKEAELASRFQITRKLQVI